MSEQDTPRTTRSGKTRLTEEEVKQIQEEKRKKRQEKLNRPVQQRYSSQSSSDSEIEENSDSNEFSPAIDSVVDRDLSSNLENVSFTEKPSDSNPQVPSSPSNFPSSANPKDSDSDSKNSLDDLDKDPIFGIFRRSLLTNKTKMTDQPQFQTSEFHKLIPVYDGSVKDLQHFISCCDFFYKNLDARFHEKFYHALVSKLKSKAFDLYNNHTYKDWPEFKIALKKYFSVRKTFETYQLELANIRQGKLSVQEYSQNIEEILREMNNIGKEIKVENASGEKFFRAQNEKLALRAYVNGLNSPLKTILRARKFENLDDLIRDALELEAEENLRNPQPTYSSKSCSYCHRTNHTIDQCFRRNNNNNNTNFSRNNSNQNRSNNNSNRNNFGNYSNNNGYNRNGNSNNNSNRNSNFNSGRNNNSNNYNNNNNNNSNSNNNSNNNRRNSQNYSNRDNNSNNSNGNNNRNGGNNRNNGNSNQSNSNGNRQNSNQHVRFLETEQKNETPQTAEMDNASLNFLLN